MRTKVEGVVVSKGDNLDIEDEKNLDTTQDSSGIGNRIVVEDEDELPSRIFNSTFNDALFFRTYSGGISFADPFSFNAPASR